MVQSVSPEQIIQCGVDPPTALTLAPLINQRLATLTAIDCWQDLTRHVLRPDHPIALHQWLHKLVFAEWNTPPPAWFPTPEQVQETNVAALMQEVEIYSYPKLHRWSTHDRAAFWETMMQRLGIRFRRPYTQLVDLSSIESPQWLVDAQFNIVESCFQAAGDAPAILFQTEQGALQAWTYAELQALTNRVANGLVKLGLQLGDRVAIDLPMTAYSVAIYLGVIQAGCVVVSIADSFAPHEIATRLRIAPAQAIFTQDYIRRSGKVLPLYAKVIEAQAPQAIVLSSGAVPEVDWRSGDLTWQEFLSADPHFEPLPAAASTHTNILFSSGTTGDPKAIPWTHTTPIKCATDAHLHHDIHPGDVLAWSTNLGWMMGPWLIYASLINRATIALYEGAPTTRGYGEFIQAAQVTMLGVVPSLVSAWKATQCMQGLDWSAIKAFSSTGECSNPQDMLFLMALAGYKPIIEYCGGTEIGGGYITGTLLHPCIPATCTTPALGLDIVILDAENRSAPQGEAFIVPPSIGLSIALLNKDHHQVYFEDTPVGLSVPLRRHGDYLEQLPNGYYRVCGRVDDTMNLGGIKVSSADIEQVLHRVADVQEVAAIAVAPPQGGPSQLIVYAVVSPSAHRSPSDLKAQLQTVIAQQLNPLFKIHDLVIVDSLPRTASNKVMRRVLRDHYALPSHIPHPTSPIT